MAKKLRTTQLLVLIKKKKRVLPLLTKAANLLMLTNANCGGFNIGNRLCAFFYFVSVL